MKRTMILLLATAGSLLAIVNCSDDETTTTTGTTTMSSSSGSGSGGAGGNSNNPPAPALSPQIVDRMGRPAINAALNATFESDMAVKGAAKDAYNTAQPAEWSMKFQAELEKNLAVIDALNGVCGDQALAGMSAVAGRYAGLAGALADDRLWVKLDADSCGTYLAVEANAALGIANMDCGGRAPSYDVIDASFSVLATGQTSGVTDGVPKPANVDSTMFPYLADPKM